MWTRSLWSQGNTLRCPSFHILLQELAISFYPRRHEILCILISTLIFVIVRLVLSLRRTECVQLFVLQVILWLSFCSNEGCVRWAIYESFSSPLFFLLFFVLFSVMSLQVKSTIFKILLALTIARSILQLVNLTRQLFMLMVLKYSVLCLVAIIKLQIFVRELGSLRMRTVTAIIFHIRKHCIVLGLFFPTPCLLSESKLSLIEYFLLFFYSFRIINHVCWWNCAILVYYLFNCFSCYWINTLTLHLHRWSINPSKDLPHPMEIFSFSIHNRGIEDEFIHWRS